MLNANECIEKILSKIKLDILNFDEEEDFDITVNFEESNNGE